jgi:hypothetical protein
MGVGRKTLSINELDMLESKKIYRLSMTLRISGKRKAQVVTMHNIEA